VDREGKVHAHRFVATAATNGPEAVIGQIERLVGAVMEDVGRAEILGLGVGAPGPVDPVAGIVLSAPSLHGWIDVPLRAILRERSGLPVAVHNDGNVAVLGEWRFGSGRGCRDFVYITVSTGIGGGIMADGRLLLGRKGMAGEIGHMIVAEHGPRCSCGNRGCWEAVASGTALSRAAGTALASGRRSSILALAAGEPIAGRHVMAAAAEGDEVALDLVRREGELLGLGLVGLLHLFSPERIALGGGVMHGLALLEPHIRHVVSERAMPAYRDVPICAAQLGDAAGVIGAAALMLADTSDFNP